MTILAQDADLLRDEISRRRWDTPEGFGGIGAAGAVGGEVIRQLSQQAIVNSILGEYEAIRNDKENYDQRLQSLNNTYQNFVNKTGNEVEEFVAAPNFYAAQTTPGGKDIVYLDPTAPQNSHFAHELGHIAMNHSNDPLSFLQHSGLGRTLHRNSAPLGIAGALAGFAAAGPGRGRRMAGTALGSLAGVGASSANTLYEAEASRRGHAYLNPEDTSTSEYLGDVVPAGLTYALAGPVQSALAALATGAAAMAISAPRQRLGVRSGAIDPANLANTA